MKLYLVLINALGLLVMCLDKYFARHHMSRVPERTLFLLALLGGSLGCILGMQLARHKTRHWQFVWGMPGILLLQILIFLILSRQQLGWPFSK